MEGLNNKLKAVKTPASSLRSEEDARRVDHTHGHRCLDDSLLQENIRRYCLIRKNAGVPSLAAWLRNTLLGISLARTIEFSGPGKRLVACAGKSY